mmetsp:Transcript_4385/g.27948  ORF Transcript_4385/g.27948 Transcript_4385/m.27948 type:complete len:201 (-) Transcript_4385:655-1257(-)
MRVTMGRRRRERRRQRCAKRKKRVLHDRASKQKSWEGRADASADRNGSAGGGTGTGGNERSEEIRRNGSQPRRGKDPGHARGRTGRLSHRCRPEKRDRGCAGRTNRSGGGHLRMQQREKHHLSTCTRERHGVPPGTPEDPDVFQRWRYGSAYHEGQLGQGFGIRIERTSGLCTSRSNPHLLGLWGRRKGTVRRRSRTARR